MSENNQLQSSCIFPTEPILGTVSTSISFSGGTPNGPGFEKSFTLKVPAGNIYSISDTEGRAAVNVTFNF